MPRRPSAPPERSALEDGTRLLARRPLTRAEVRGRLLASGHPPDDVERALERLAAISAIDDEALARHWIEVRAARRGHGPGRLARDLETRGVDPAVVRRALAGALVEGAVDVDATLRREAEKRVRRLGTRRDRTAYARVYNALLRAGFEPGAIHDALAAHFSGPGESPDETPDGTEANDDDLA